MKRINVGQGKGHISVSEDQRKAVVVIDGKFSAEELQSLIADIAAGRAQMDPPVPNTEPSRTPEANLDLNISMWDDPSLSLRLLKDGRIRLWIMNPGIGWLAFNIPVDKACTMRDYLVANTPDEIDGTEFFSDGFSKGETQH